MRYFISLVLLVFLSCFGQDDYPNSGSLETKKVGGWGFKGGLNIATIGGDGMDGEDIEYNKGIVFGMFMESPINESVSFQCELLYTMKGYHYVLEESFSDVDYIEELSMDGYMNFNYLEVPFILKFGIPSGSKITPNMYAGGSVSLNIKSEVNYKIEYYYYDGYLEESGSDSGTENVDGISELDFGILIGAGLDIPLKNGKFIFDLRYTYGLATILDEYDIDAFNRVFSLSVGYGF